MNLGQLKATKTYETQTVDLTPDLARSLQRHLVWLRSEALRLGHGQPEWIFPNKAWHPLDKGTAGDAFRRALKRAKLPGFRLYDLRHTFASLLLAAGAPITYVSSQLGHANPRRPPCATTRGGSRARGAAGWTRSTRLVPNLEPKSGTKRISTSASSRKLLEWLVSRPGLEPGTP